MDFVIGGIVLSKNNQEREEMLALIKKYDEAYYNQDAPLVEDSEYDALRNAYIKKYGSKDLNYVPGSANTTTFRKFKHLFPVLSLDKIKEGEIDKLKKATDKLEQLVIEPKLDGLTVVCYPTNTEPIYVTRGNGKIGEILPHFLSKYERGVFKTDEQSIIRGEVYMSINVFNEINTERGKQGLPLFKNPRNAAAGILRNKERSPYLDRLEYICYDVLNSTKKQSDKHAYIANETTFRAVDQFKCSALPNKPEVFDAALKKAYLHYKNDTSIPVDGMVVKSDIYDAIDKFGSTEHHPNNAFAWKAAQLKAVTTLKDVKWQLGKTYITPVAVFEDVELDGSTISAASLHNIKYIQDLDLHYGDIVEIEKANEIIPQITKVLKHCTDKPINIINKCPACNKPIAIINGQAICDNPDCCGRQKQRLLLAIGKKALDMDGISEGLINKIEERFGQVTIAKLFSLTIGDFLELPGIKSKMAEKMYNTIQARKKVPLDRFIVAANIPMLGGHAAKIIADHIGSYDKLMSYLKRKNVLNKDPKELGLGKVVFTNLVNYKERLAELAETIEPMPVKIKAEANTNTKRICITGTLSRPRKEIEKLIIKAEYSLANTVSKTTDYLVCNNVSSSSKYQKAKELNIKIITEQELYSILEKDSQNES